MYIKGLPVPVLKSDFYYVYDGEVVNLFDSEGEFQKSFKPDCDPSGIEEWVDGYEQGYNNGKLFGLSSGAQAVQKKILDALGVGNQLHEMQRSIKTLGGVLYHHDGIFKDDVAEIAGRG